MPRYAADRYTTFRGVIDARFRGVFHVVSDRSGPTETGVIGTMPRQAAAPADPTPTDLEAFTVQEVAKRLRVHEDFVYRRVASGELGHIRAGDGPRSAIRIMPSQLQKYLDDHRVEV